MKKAYRLLLLVALCAGMGCQSVPGAGDGLTLGANKGTEELPRTIEPTPVCEYPDTVWGSLCFAFDSSNLSGGQQETIRIIALHLQDHAEEAIQLVGHTCDLGDADYNYLLGLRRAEAIKNQLVSMKIAPGRVSVTSEGETRPAVPNNSPLNRSLNRRVEFKVVTLN